MNDANTLPKWSVVFAAIGLSFFVYWLVFLIFHPVSYDVSEGAIYNMIFSFIRGDGLYPALKAPPYFVTPYTPFSMLIVGGFIKLFGTSFWVGRIVSMSAFFGSIYVATRLISERSHNFTYYFVMMLFMLCSYHVVTNVESFSMQWIGIFCSILGLAVFKKNTYIGLFIMTLGIMTKQNQLAAPAAALLWLFIQDWKKVFIPLIFFLICIAVELLMFNMVFGPEFFKHIIKYAAGSYSVMNFARLTAYCIAPYLILFSLAVGAIRAGLFDKNKNLIILYFCFNFLLTFMTFRVGSDSKYYQEFYLSLFMLTVPYAFSIRGWSLKALILQMIILSLFSAYMFRWNSVRVAEKAVAVNSIVTDLKGLNGDVIVEDPQIALRSGHRLYFEAFPMTELSKRGIWNQRKFVEDISDGKFQALALQFDLEKDDIYFSSKERFTKSMLDAMRAGYYLDKRYGPIYLYKPKQEKSDREKL